MPENPEKKLGGYIIETPSSDSAIARTIDGLRREISAAVGEPTDAITAELLPPRELGLTTNTEKVVINDHLDDLRKDKLTHTDSALGKFILHRRELKKSA